MNFNKDEHDQDGVRGFSVKTYQSKKNTGLFSEKMDIGWKSPYFWFFEKYLIHDFAYCRNDYALVLCSFIGYDVSIFRSSSDSWITIDICYKKLCLRKSLYDCSNITNNKYIRWHNTANCFVLNVQGARSKFWHRSRGYNS